MARRWALWAGIIGAATAPRERVHYTHRTERERGGRAQGRRAPDWGGSLDCSHKAKVVGAPLVCYTDVENVVRNWAIHFYKYQGDLFLNGECLSIRPGSVGIIPPAIR